MSTLSPFLTLNESYKQVDRWVRANLSRAGLRVVQTFDLQIARQAHPECSCPHHGTEQCSCQLVILLIYSKQEEPATLVIHGQDGTTWLSFSTPLEVRGHQPLETTVRNLLMVHQSDLSAAATSQRYSSNS
jgi:hypothetical protein